MAIRRGRERERDRAQQGPGQRGDRLELIQGVRGDDHARPPLWSLRLLGRAIREGWPIPDDKRLALLEHLRDVLESDCPDRRDRSWISAARCLLQADKANLRAEEGKDANST